MIPLDDNWSVSLDTGILERGNGRPLSFFDQPRATSIRSSESGSVGVHPDVNIPDATPIIGDRTIIYPRESGEGTEEIKVAPNSALSKAVETLRASLKKA